MKAYIALGKCGDICSSLPIIYHEFIKSGRKPNVVVSQQYAWIFDRVPFAEVTAFPGDWTDLDGALLFAKQRFSEVVCLSVFGRDFPIHQKTSSFQLEAYERAGVLHLWDKLPMPDIWLNPAMVASDTPSPSVILFADYSESSPFMQANELFSLLQETFPRHVILRTSQMRKEAHFFDCLAWYEAADALVTIETSHLHLSAASKTPVFALATDRPAKWNGSAWSKRFAFYCRYSEFSARKQELVDAMRDQLSGRIKPEIVEMNATPLMVR